MFKSVSLFLTIALFAWLMPLGAFIKKTEEKTACGGKRAFHMCSMMQGKADPNPSSTVSLQNASDFGNSAQSQASGSVSDDLLMPSRVLASGQPDLFRAQEAASFRYRTIYSGVLQPPPEYPLSF
ncbi:MAG TPA: hypothetical protein VD883_04500 [Candidatus Omnitrophota bacterium]|nr:hypothetical protein [Candidatus Omnitrophota bacterium]